MSYKYNLYPEAEKKLVETGLAERIKKATENDDFPNTHSFLGQRELPEMMKEMQNQGFFKENSDFFAKTYRPKLEAYYKNQELHKWVVKKDGKEEKSDSEWDDFMLFSGYLASFVLKPKEFWNFEKFGFSSAFDFFGSIGAFAWGLGMSDFYRGYKWKSSEGKRQFVTQVTGDTNGDFRLFRDELTPYETIDPLGNPVHYRPELDSDHQSVCGYHSVEPALLVTLMKYVEQEKLLCPLLTPSGLKEMADELSKLKQGLPTFADYGSRTDAMLEFTHYDVPIPRLNDKTNYNPHGIFVDSQGVYSIYVDGEGLAFVYEHKDNAGQMALQLPKDEVEQVIKGLFVQAILAQGRTHPGHLWNTVMYKLSGKYEEDMKRLNLDNPKPS